MKELVSELVGILELESQLVKELVEILQEDHRRIIAQDVQGLEESNHQKEALVLRFQTFEQSRLQLTQRLGHMLGLGPDELRVSILSPRLGPSGPELEQAAENLRSLVGSLIELVAVSRGFLEQSIVGIRGLLGLIQSLRTPDPQIYDARGQLETASSSEAMAVRREV